MQQNRLGPLLARRRQDGRWKDQGPNPNAGPALSGSQQIYLHVPHQNCGMELLPASGGIYGYKYRYSTSISDFSA